MKGVQGFKGPIHGRTVCTIQAVVQIVWSCVVWFDCLHNSLRNTGCCANCWIVCGVVCLHNSLRNTDCCANCLIMCGVVWLFAQQFAQYRLLCKLFDRVWCGLIVCTTVWWFSNRFEFWCATIRLWNILTYNTSTLSICYHHCCHQYLLGLVSGVPRGVWGVQTPPEIPKI